MTIDDDYFDAVINAEGPNPPGPTLANDIRSRLLTTEQLRKLPPPVGLVDGLLYLDSLAMLYGASGAGKSHVALDLAHTVSALSFWHGHRVTNGAVLYVAAEGAPGVGIRVDAWEQHHQQASTVTWLPSAVSIIDAGWASALAEVVADLRPVLVVLDTFARSIVGADENSARDVGIAVANLDMIRRAAGCCVLVVHHSGKDRTAGARGSTALKAAVDTELEVIGDDTRLTLKNTKQKNAREEPPINFTLVPVDGTASVVIEQAGKATSGELPAGVFDTLDALRQIDVPGGVAASVWKAASTVPESTFYRHRAGLLERGHIVNVGTDRQPRYRPTELEA